MFRTLVFLSLIVFVFSQDSYLPYIDNDMLGTGFFANAGIIRLDGSQKAFSREFSLRDGELEKLERLLTYPNFASRIFDIDGKEYGKVKSGNGWIFGARQDRNGDNKNGAIIAKTTNSIIIGVIADRILPFQGIEVVEKMVDLFNREGY